MSVLLKVSREIRPFSRNGYSMEHFGHWSTTEGEFCMNNPTDFQIT